MSITYQPKNRKRNKTHGFLSRQKKATGRMVILRRRRKNRKKLSV
ncbi:MAG: 50S ribosomal protein L34 [Patescibacteria group bacterium]